MPQHSELTVLITPNIPNPGEADHVLARLLSSLREIEFWGHGPLVWNLSDAELRDSGLSHAFQARMSAGDQFASAGYSKTPHSLLTMEELAHELGTPSTAVIPPRCDSERRDVDVAYRAVDVPLILGRRNTRAGEELIGYRQGMLSTAPLLQILPLLSRNRDSPWSMRRLGRLILRTAARRGQYLVLHAVITDEEEADQLIRFLRRTGTSAIFQSRARLAGLRLSQSADPKAGGSISPLYTAVGDPLEPARLYRTLALRNSDSAGRTDSTDSTDSASNTRPEPSVLDSWLSVSKTPGNHAAKDSGYTSSRYQVVASMQGESSLSEGELELRCTEGAPTELRVAGQTMLQGVLPIARFYSGSQGIALEPRGVVSIESEFARGLNARFAFPNDDLATSRLSIRYLFFEGSPALFIELELDLKVPAGFAERHSFSCLSFRPTPGAEVYATHPMQKQSETALTDASPQHGIAASLRVEKGTSALAIGALAPVANGVSALLYRTDSRLSLGPSYGPTQTAFVDGLLDRRVVILSVSRPGRTTQTPISASIRSQLHDPICFLA